MLLHVIPKHMSIESSYVRYTSLRMVICHWKPNPYVFFPPGENQFSCSQLIWPDVALYLGLRSFVLVGFSNPSWYVLWCTPFSAHVWVITLVRHYRFIFWCYLETQFHSKLTEIFWLLHCFYYIIRKVT